MVSGIFVLIGRMQPDDCEKFGLSDCFRELSRWDYFGIILLIFAIAATTASFSVEKLEN